MTTKDVNLWGIHAGKTGDAERLFFTHDCVAIGWPEIGDLSKLAADRDAFKAAVALAFPNHKPGAIPNNAGQLFRFVHELKRADIIVYPSKRDRLVHLGRINGDYVYDPKTEPAYPNTREVTWTRQVPRSHFTQGALYEIGSAMSLFAVKNYADEFRAALEGKTAPPVVDKDESIAQVAEDIEQTTRDFVLKRLAQELKGHPFAEFVAHLLSAMGYRTRVSPEGPDGGIDIVAHRDELGFEPPIIKVQVKSTEGSVGDPVVSALYGKVGPSEFGLLVTLGSITSQATNFAKSKSNLRLIDGEELVALIFSHYEEFDSRYKGLVPLRRVYVPQVLSETDE